jgi:chromosome segregation ATPase
MNTSDNSELTGNEAHLLAENESLKNLLQEYQHLLIQKEAVQYELQQQANAGAELKSNYDSQGHYLQTLKNYISDLLQKAEVAIQNEREMEKQVSISASSGYQLEEIKIKYNYLQVQLNDLSERLQQLYNQNAVLQQHTSRIAELESLLSNAEAEIEELKFGTDNERP